MHGSRGQAMCLLQRSLLLSELEDLSEPTLSDIRQPRLNSPLTAPLPIMWDTKLPFVIAGAISNQGVVWAFD